MIFKFLVNFSIRNFFKKIKKIIIIEMQNIIKILIH
jgi:hypothetical protein